MPTKDKIKKLTDELETEVILNLDLIKLIKETTNKKIKCPR